MNFTAIRHPDDAESRMVVTEAHISPDALLQLRQRRPLGWRGVSTNYILLPIVSVVNGLENGFKQSSGRRHDWRSCLADGMLYSLLCVLPLAW